MTKPVGQPVPLSRKILNHPRPFPKFNDRSMNRPQEAVKPRVSSQRVSQNVGIQTIILGSCHGEAVTEPVELFRIDGMHQEASVHKMFNDRPMGHFYTDGDILRFLTCDRSYPGGKFRKPVTTVRECTMT
jgi:hypothetical protein